jgi:hypothetical protein
MLLRYVMTISMACVCSLGNAAVPNCADVPRRLEETPFEFAGPEGMTVDVSVPGDARRLAGCRTFVVPARRNLVSGQMYCLTLGEIPNHSGLQLRATLSVVSPVARVRTFLVHNSVPVAVGEDDIVKILNGVVVTKVIYIPAPEFKELAWPVETITSYRIDPGHDPSVEATRRGDIVAILCVDRAPRGLAGSCDGCRQTCVSRFARCLSPKKPESARRTREGCPRWDHCDTLMRRWRVTR